MEPNPVQYSSVKHTVIHPNFLHTNSTSHRWAFSAIAELIDNASDDAEATQFCIDLQQFEVTGKDGTSKEVDTLVFMDNGTGMNPLQLHKMLGFGHSDKATNARAIGRFGNGFKAGSMRLGQDALVLTKCTTSQSAGFLSQTFLKATGCEDILVPMVTWDLEGRRLGADQADLKQSLDAIMRYSIFQDEESLLAQLRAMPTTGTIVIISGLRRDDSGALELDFDSDTNDIRIARDIAYGDEAFPAENFQQMRLGQARSTDVKLDYSLRQYVSVLYKVPRMQIFVREEKVRTQRVTSLLRGKMLERFQLRNHTLAYADIEMGFNTEDPSLYGMMIYHRNRLIRPYHRVGMQLEPNDKGVGVLGVVQADYLEPTHNKQDFNDTKEYRTLQKKLAEILQVYWWDKVEEHGPGRPLALPNPWAAARGAPSPQQEAPQQNGSESTATVPDDLWVQCDEPRCLKWRKMPPGWSKAQVEAAQEDGSWYCRLNPDPTAAAAGCKIPEETYAAPESAAADTRTVKRRYQEAKEKDRSARKRKQQAIEETAADQRRMEAVKQQQAMALLALRMAQQQQQQQQQQLMQHEHQRLLLQQHLQRSQAQNGRAHGSSSAPAAAAPGRSLADLVPTSAGVPVLALPAAASAPVTASAAAPAVPVNRLPPPAMASESMQRPAATAPAQAAPTAIATAAAAGAKAAAAHSSLPTRAERLEAQATAAEAAAACGSSDRAPSAAAVSATPSEQQGSAVAEQAQSNAQQKADAGVSSTGAPAAAEALRPRCSTDDIDTEMASEAAAAPATEPPEALSLAQTQQTRGKAAAEKLPDCLHNTPAGPSGSTASDVAPAEHPTAVVSAASPGTPAANGPSSEQSNEAVSGGTNERHTSLSARQPERVEVLNSLNRVKAKVMGLEKDMQSRQATIDSLQTQLAGLESDLCSRNSVVDALSNNLRKVLSHCVGGGNASRAFDEITPEQLAGFDVDIFWQNLKNTVPTFRA